MRAITQQITVPARTPEHDVDPLFVNRWSPRAFRPDPVPRNVLDSMVEAARWAPSSMNLQPWRFIIGQGETRASWNDLLMGFNQAWAPNAPVMVWVVARKTFGPGTHQPADTPNRHALFDTGAATVQFVLEGERHGVKAHYLGGVDVKRAHERLGLGPDDELVCALVLGYPAEAETLPEALRAREKPSDRKSANIIARFV
jgi:nitroreductase